MTPKQRRDRLLKNRPIIRPLQIYNGSGYHKDIGILWSAHQLKPFPSIPEDMPQEDFAKAFEEMAGEVDFFMIEDDNRSFESERGPVSLIGIFNDGWKVEPHSDTFPWATKKNILRVAVSLLHWIQYKKIGVCVIKCEESSKNLFDHCSKYGVLFYVGKIVGGNVNGDELIYSIMGKANPKRKATVR